MEDVQSHYDGMIYQYSKDNHIYDYTYFNFRIKV